MMSDNLTNLDPETMSLDDLRALANQTMQDNAAPAAPSANAQPRDENGRFAKPENAPVQDAEAQGDDEEQDAAPDKVIYRKEIDLGDGSGVQVFEADSLEELVEKFAKAQTHATRKIRELNQAMKTRQQPTQQPEHKLTPDEEFLLAQELMAQPTEAFKKLFRETTGFDISDFRTKLERVSAFEKAQAENATAQEFISTHPDYAAVPGNGERMTAYLETYRLEATPENLERAYQSLKNSGLLELKDTVKADDTANGADTSRIAKPANEAAPVQHRKRAASGLSGRRAVSAPSRSTGPTEQELYSMPLEQLRELANKAPSEEF